MSGGDSAAVAADRPTFDVTTHDIEYLRHEGGPLLARLSLPQGPGPFPLVLEVHGGAWCRGDRHDEDRLNHALARRGIAVAALDFRMPPQAGYPASLADINYALRWFKSQAAQWSSRPELVGLMGLSSGAHQAILAAMRPHDARYAQTPLEGAAPGIDARAAFVVMCWPVIDPLGRYRYARQLQAGGQPYPPAIDRVIPDHITYWGAEDQMAEGSPVLALERGEAVQTPPVLYLQGELDIVHPRAHLERFVAGWRATGGQVELRLFPGEAEGFVNKNPDGPSTAQAIADIVRFIRASCGEDAIAS